MKTKSIWGGNTATYTQLGGKNTELFYCAEYCYWYKNAIIDFQ